MKIKEKIEELEHHHCKKCNLCGKELGLVYSKEEVDKIVEEKQ